jgi:hypothetical protein
MLSLRFGKKKKEMKRRCWFDEGTVPEEASLSIQGCVRFSLEGSKKQSYKLEV